LLVVKYQHAEQLDLLDLIVRRRRQALNRRRLDAVALDLAISFNAWGESTVPLSCPPGKLGLRVAAKAAAAAQVVPSR
jgi:hypothetical protein